MTIDESIKLQMGSLMIQVLVLQHQLDEANEQLKNEQLKAVRLTDENKTEKEKENKL